MLSLICGLREQDPGEGVQSVHESVSMPFSARKVLLLFVHQHSAFSHPSEPLGRC